jgi:K(+)-stimulated pyrophosphate-energized sodium pump
MDHGLEEWFDINPVSIGLPALITSIIGLLVAGGMVYTISQKPTRLEENGDPKRKEMSDMVEKLGKVINKGATTFLLTEYSYLVCVALCLFVLVSAAVNWRTGICYITGATSSATCGFIGMMIATYANSRTAIAAEKGLNDALTVSFMSGSVMGLTVVCVGLGAISVLLMAFGGEAIGGVGALTGFGMGASTVSIFARVAGGIFTKAADVGADLVGKVEEDFPEDDIRNPATIADNVGDNVGDVAGMGADLFSSFVGSIIASSVLGLKYYGNAGIALPYWISMAGIVAALLGMLTIRTKENASQTDLLNVLRTAMFTAAIFELGFMAVIVYILDLTWTLYFCLMIGLAAGISISFWSEYFTSGAYPPTQNIANSGVFGPGNVIIEGISVGSYSTVGPVLIIAGTIIAVKELSGSAFGIALASTGLLSILAITLATDAYGPVADNAGGIAEMSKMPEHVRENTDALDALGNTTAAVGKGFAVGSAVLTAVSLLTTYTIRVGIADSLDPINNKFFMPGVLIGAMIPYAFAAMTMGAVSAAAGAVVVEVRRQLKEIKGLREGAPGVEADHASCVAMTTGAALYLMVPPALLVILSPLILGIGLGPEMLAGVLFGAISSGFVLGGMMNAAGGAWDNAKKMNEKDGQKGSFKHKSTVVGDTVGDPFKDTSGPAINILIKLMSYISVVLVPVFRNQKDYWWASLIILGVLAIGTPFYISMCPQAIKAEERMKTVTAAAPGQGDVNGGSDNCDLDCGKTYELVPAETVDIVV